MMGVFEYMTLRRTLVSVTEKVMLDPVLSQMNPAHSFISCFFKIH
jgi:hypothetical protein